MSEKAFTLLELLLVIAIISVLGSVVVFNLRPADLLNSAIRSRSKAHAEEIEKAINAYITDNGGNLPASLAALPAGLYDICKQDSVACPGGAISLDSLISAGYLSYIAQTSDQQGSELSGYKVSKGSNGQVSVRKYTSAIQDVAVINEDGSVFYAAGSGTYTKYTSDTTLSAFDNNIGPGSYQRGYIEWNISSIRSDAVIQSAKFLYHGQNAPASNTQIKSLLSRPSSVTATQLYNAINSGSLYVSSVFQTGDNKIIDLGVSIISDLTNNLGTGWFAIGFSPTATLSTTSIYSEDYSSTNPKPTLRITYSYPE